jgi:uncharacterized protein YprB with RNaseH-like and TPR domain
MKYIVFDIETTGLKPWFNDKITFICAKDSEGLIFSIPLEEKRVTDEQDLILAFLEWLGSYKEEYTLITCNGIDFDIPFILTRAVRNGIMPKKDHIFLRFKQFDLQTLTNKKVSLDDLSKLFNTEKKSNKGYNAIEMFNNGWISELEDYCMQDVKVTEQIYLKYMELQDDKKNKMQSL